MNPKTKSPEIARLRHVTRYFYDLQKMRIASGNRDNSLDVELDEDSKDFMVRNATMLEDIEKNANKEMERLLRSVPIYTKWLVDQRGIGTTMAGMLISYINIENCHTVSKLWAWCGLKVVNGEAHRRRRGETAGFDPWLKSKVVGVMAKMLIQCCNLDHSGYYTFSRIANPNYDKEAKADKEDTEKYFIRVLPSQDASPETMRLRAKELNAPAWVKTITIRMFYNGVPWRKFYDDRKNRKASMRVPQCMGCNGTGQYKLSGKDQERISDLRQLEAAGRLREDQAEQLKELSGSDGSSCSNCGGTGGPAPWGRSAAHRDADAKRYMVKEFLKVFWEEWRKLEGLPVRPSYAEEYLGIKHH